jgi:hypothetical protein
LFLSLFRFLFHSFFRFMQGAQGSVRNFGGGDIASTQIAIPNASSIVGTDDTLIAIPAR